MNLRKYSQRRINWTFAKTTIVIAGVFLLGGFLMSTETTVEVEKEVVKEVHKDETAWQELKAVDDELIGYCSDFAHLSSSSFTAVANYDLVTLENNTREIERLSPKIENAIGRRKDVLQKLDY